LVLPPLRSYQLQLVHERARDVSIVSATQVGKTTGVGCWMLGESWANPRTVGGWYAPTTDVLMPGYRLILGMALTAGVLAGKVERPYPEIRLTNGSLVMFRSWHEPEHMRGPALHRFVADEAGLLNWEALGIMRSRRAATGGPGRLIGTPGPNDGPFRKLCADGDDPDRDPLLAATYRWTWRVQANEFCSCRSERIKLDAPPDVGPHALECQAREYIAGVHHEYLTLPTAIFRSLYEADEATDESAIFRPECIASKTEAGVLQTAPLPGHRYAIGVDVGQEVDYLVASVWDANLTHLCAMERWRGVPSPESETRLIALSQAWGNAPLTIETNGPGRPLFDGLAHRGAPVREWVTTAQSKGPAILAFARDLHDPDSTLSLAPLPPLQDELRVFRFERTLSGYRYTAPSGMHDDCVMAAVVGYQALTNPHAGMLDYLRSLSREKAADAEQAEKDREKRPGSPFDNQAHERSGWMDA